MFLHLCFIKTCLCNVLLIGINPLVDVGEDDLFVIYVI